MSDWYLTGNLGYMFNGAAKEFQWLGSGERTVNASLTDWRVGLGRNFGAWEVEGGYRGASWSFDSTTMCYGYSSCDFKWGGWYIGLNFTMP